MKKKREKTQKKTLQRTAYCRILTQFHENANATETRANYFSSFRQKF